MADIEETRKCFADLEKSLSRCKRNLSPDVIELVAEANQCVLDLQGNGGPTSLEDMAIYPTLGLLVPKSLLCLYDNTCTDTEPGRASSHQESTGDVKSGPGLRLTTLPKALTNSMNTKVPKVLGHLRYTVYGVPVSRSDKQPEDLGQFLARALNETHILLILALRLLKDELLPPGANENDTGCPFVSLAPKALKHAKDVRQWGERGHRLPDGISDENFPTQPFIRSITFSLVSGDMASMETATTGGSYQVEGTSRSKKRKRDDKDDQVQWKRRRWWFGWLW